MIVDPMLFFIQITKCGHYVKLPDLPSIQIYMYSTDDNAGVLVYLCTFKCVCLCTSLLV